MAHGDTAIDEPNGSEQHLVLLETAGNQSFIFATTGRLGHANASQLLHSVVEEALADYDLRASKGCDRPIPSARVGSEPTPEGEGFDWFVANERVVQATCDGLALPALADDPGLPY